MPVRTMRLPQDIPAVIEVTHKSFQYPDHPEWSLQTDEAESITEQLQSVRRFWPVIALMQRLSPSFRDQFAGFVAKEDGAPVGCVFVARQGDAGRREVANVAVLPEYRRRGIARLLVEAAIAYARERKSTALTLDVIAENFPAVTLYSSLGFVRYEDTLTLSHAQDTPVSAPELPAGYTMSDTSFANWRPRYELAKRITPEEIAALAPVKEAEYRVSSTERIAAALIGRLSGDRHLQLVIRAPDGVVIAAARYIARTHPGGITQCWPLLDPTHATLAQFLVKALRQMLQQQSPGRRMEMTIPGWQQALIAAAQAEGFTERIHSLKMQKTL